MEVDDNATSVWATLGASAIAAISAPPRRDALSVVVPVTVVYVAIFVTGVAGNIVTVIVIGRCRCMHTPTNYYLMSLAVSDLLLLLSGLPQEVYSIWIRYPYPFGDAFCMLRGLAAEAAANASVLTITAFTVERYMAICKPFETASRAQSPSRGQRVFRMIAVVWASALCCACVQAMQFGVVALGVPPMAACTQVRVLLEHSFEAATVLFFVAPMTLICVLYTLIAVRLHRQRRDAVSHHNASCASSLRHVAAKKRVIKMLAAVVVAFFLCWAPFHAQRLVAIHGREVQPRLYDMLTYVSGVLHYVSATVNPILYHSMSRKFRKAGKDTLASLLPQLEWSKQRRARRPHHHGPQCGSGGGGLCRGPAIYRHRHPPPGVPSTGDSSSTSSSDGEGETSMGGTMVAQTTSAGGRGSRAGVREGSPTRTRRTSRPGRPSRVSRSGSGPGLAVSALSPDRPDVVLTASAAGAGVPVGRPQPGGGLALAS